jgi:uncharacterized protein (DUF58 family)
LNLASGQSLARTLRAWLGNRVSPPASATEPLLSAEEIAGLAAQAASLAGGRSRREVHDHHAGDWVSAWFGRGLDYEESRPYAAGDDIRDMDWRTTAKSGRPYLKIYREERQPMLHLVVDRGASLRFGTRRRLKAAQAARVALLLAFAAARESLAVGATLWDQDDLELPPLHGAHGVLSLAEALAAPCPPLSTSNPHGAERDRLARLTADLPNGTRLLLVSDFSWLESEHEALLARLAHSMELLAVRISDPVEHRLPDLGPACFNDLSRPGTIWIDTHRAGQTTRPALQLERHAQCLERAGVRWVDLGSEVDDLIPVLARHV